MTLHTALCSCRSVLTARWRYTPPFVLTYLFWQQGDVTHRLLQCAGRPTWLLQVLRSLTQQALEKRCEYTLTEIENKNYIKKLLKKLCLNCQSCLMEVCGFEFRRDLNLVVNQTKWNQTASPAWLSLKQIMFFVPCGFRIMFWACREDGYCLLKPAVCPAVRLKPSCWHSTITLPCSSISCPSNFQACRKEKQLLCFRPFKPK